MFYFSVMQRVLLVFGLVLILISVSMGRIGEFWNRVSQDDPIVWNNLIITPKSHLRISSLDEMTLVMRSSANSDARLTLFIREDNGSQPRDLVKNLCGRDSCVYRPLEDERLKGAIADYVSGTPFRIVLMQLPDSRVWMEFKGPSDELGAFSGIIDDAIAQTRTQPTVLQEN